MIRQAIEFVAPRRVRVVEEAVPAPAPGELLVRTELSAISAGTELLAYRGQLPAGAAIDDVLGAFAGRRFTYPFRYGYACVGLVDAVGPGVAADWIGRRVFAFAPHASYVVARADDVVVVPEGVTAERAALYATMETAVNVVLDAEPRLGERVVVIGQGLVGLLVTSQLARFPLAALWAADEQPRRRALAGRLGATACAPGELVAAARLADGADVVVEASGDPAALDDAIAAAGAEARIVVASWYGDKRHAIDLGTWFHRGRLRLVSSQVSRIAPALGARWTRARRAATTWRALAELPVETSALVTHRVPLRDAASAYALLDERAADVLQVVLVPS